MKKHALVLLPGLLNDARLWHSLINDVADLVDCEVADLTRHDSIAALAADVLQQITADRFVLAGFSMGGYVALEIMRQAPHRVIALVLIDTSARADSPEATSTRHELLHLAERDFPAVIDTLLPRQLHAQNLQNFSIVDCIRAMAMAAGKDVFARQQRAIIARADSRESLRAMSCPVLVICGRDDAITPLAVHQEMVHLVAGAELVVVDCSGHMSVLEQPGQIAKAIRSWLARIGRTSK